MSLFCAELLLTEKAASGKTALPAESFLPVSEEPNLTLSPVIYSALGLEVRRRLSSTAMKIFYDHHAKFCVDTNVYSY